MVGSCPRCGYPSGAMAATCDGCGAALGSPARAALAPAALGSAGYVVGLGLPPGPSPLAERNPPAAGRPAAGAPAAPPDEPDRCLRCHKQAPGAHYPFFVALRQSPSGHILHEERPFLCDRCARARMRFAPLVVLLFWLPILALTLLLTRHKLWFSLPLLFVIVVLIRLAWGQLRAISHGQYRHPPYSGTVARLAIELRQKDVLRSLHRVAPEVVFLTEADREARSGNTGASERAEGAGRFEVDPR